MERRTTGVIGVTLAAALVAVLGGLLLAVHGTFAPSLPPSTAGGQPISLGETGHRIAGRVYLDGGPTPGAPLIVVLHGDAPFRKPASQYTFASTVSQLDPGIRVAALLRPGYADPFGAKSDGDRGLSAAENYSPEVISGLADAILALRTQYGAKAVLVVGYAGGAAIAADIAALHPGLVQQLLLIGCPCDVPAFRHHMGVGLIPSRSLSPMVTLAQMQTSTEIFAISGSDDRITLPQYARAYVHAARGKGIKALLLTLSGKGHEILNEDAVAEIAADGLKKLQ